MRNLVVTIVNAPGDEGVAYTLILPDGRTARIDETMDAYWALAGVIDGAFPIQEPHRFHDGEPCFPGCPAWGDDLPMTRTRLVRTASWLRSEHGENPEYDRALVELVNDLLGLSSDNRAETEQALGIIKVTDWTCPLADCGYGECSGREVNGMCEVHGNGEGKCQKAEFRVAGDGLAQMQAVIDARRVSPVETDPLMLVCRECGEAFDSLAPAYAHAQPYHGTGFDIMPESEAM